MIGFIGNADYGHLDVPQSLVDFTVQRHHALAGIDDEEDHLGRIDSRIDLLFDLLREVVGILNTHSARIDQLDKPISELHEVRDAVARNSGGGIDDGQTLPCEPVKKARFAHVGPADDGDLRNSHDLPILVDGRSLDQSGGKRCTAIPRKIIEMEVSQSPQNVLRAARQKLESLERAGVTHIPKVRNREQGAKSTEYLLPTALGSEQEREKGRKREKEIRPSSQPVQLAAAETGVPQAANASLSMTREEALSEVAMRVAACERCPVLVRNRTQTVFGVGNPHSTLIFIGEAPGADEDRQGEPFVGRAGQLLTDIITKGMKLRREDVYIMNILRCRPPDNRTPLPDEAANCREYLDAQLAIIQPQYICCLAHALRRTCWAWIQRSASSAAG